MASAEARATKPEVSFEAYVLKDGRWLITDVAHDRKTALKLGRDLAAQEEHKAVRVVRDEFDATSGESRAIVIFDSEIRIEAPPPQQPRPAPARRAPPPVAPRRAPAPAQSKGFPWLPFAATFLCLSFAATGYWYVATFY